MATKLGEQPSARSILRPKDRSSSDSSRIGKGAPNECLSRCRAWRGGAWAPRTMQRLACKDLGLRTGTVALFHPNANFDRARVALRLAGWLRSV